MLDTKAVLLIDRDKSEPGELGVFLHQCVSSDYEKRSTGRHFLCGLRTLFRAQAAGNKHWTNLQRLQQSRHGSIVLLSEKLGWRHDRRLKSIFHREERSEQRNNCLAAANVSLKHAMHLSIAGHVVDDLANRSYLRLRQRIRQSRAQLPCEPPLVLKLDSGPLRSGETIRSPHQNLHEQKF